MTGQHRNRGKKNKTAAAKQEQNILRDLARTGLHKSQILPHLPPPLFQKQQQSCLREAAAISSPTASLPCERASCAPSLCFYNFFFACMANNSHGLWDMENRSCKHATPGKKRPAVTGGFCERPCMLSPGLCLILIMDMGFLT